MRFIWTSAILAALLGPVVGCGGVTEEQKKEAEKIPDLDIDEAGVESGEAEESGDKNEENADASEDAAKEEGDASGGDSP
jgi:hypothetical protein